MKQPTRCLRSSGAASKSMPGAWRERMGWRTGAHPAREEIRWATLSQAPLVLCAGAPMGFDELGVASRLLISLAPCRSTTSEAGFPVGATD